MRLSKAVGIILWTTPSVDCFPGKNFHVCTPTMNHKTQYENSDKGFEHFMLLFVDYNLDVI